MGLVFVLVLAGCGATKVEAVRLYCEGVEPRTIAKRLSIRDTMMRRKWAYNLGSFGATDPDRHSDSAHEMVVTCTLKDERVPDIATVDYEQPAKELPHG